MRDLSAPRPGVASSRFTLLCGDVSYMCQEITIMNTLELTRMAVELASQNEELSKKISGGVKKWQTK